MSDVMQTDEIYHEEVPFTFVKYLVVLEIALGLSRGRFGRFVFSTRNSDEVISIVEQY